MDVLDLSVLDSLSSDGGDGGATVSTVSSGSGISIAAIKARIHMFLLERSEKSGLGHVTNGRNWLMTSAAASANGTST